jgi:hypothetical protein
MPPRAVQRCQVLLGGFPRVEQCCHHHDLPGPEAWLSDPDPRLSNREELG